MNEKKEIFILFIIILMGWIIITSIFYLNQPTVSELNLCKFVGGEHDDFGILGIKRKACKIGHTYVAEEYLNAYNKCKELKPNWADRTVFSKHFFGKLCSYEKGNDFREIKYRKETYYLINNQYLGKGIND